MIWICMKRFNIYRFMGFCNWIFQVLISWNVLQGNNAQKWIWSSLLQRSTQEDFKEIYFAFFWCLLFFLWILESEMNLLEIHIGNDFRNWKTLIAPRPAFGPRWQPAALASPAGAAGPCARCTMCAHRGGGAQWRDHDPVARGREGLCEAWPKPNGRGNWHAEALLTMNMWWR
jgi:hypothetical protein